MLHPIFAARNASDLEKATLDDSMASSISQDHYEEAPAVDFALPAQGVKRVGTDSCPSDQSACSDEDVDDDALYREAKRPRIDEPAVHDAAPPVKEPVIEAVHDAAAPDAKEPVNDVDAAQLLLSMFAKPRMPARMPVHVPVSPSASPAGSPRLDPLSPRPVAPLVVDGRGTCLDRLQSLGAAKISRLQAYGIDTVEKLAVVDVRDYPMVRLITGNKRPDRASTTIAKWRDIAQTFLARRGAGVIEPPPKKRRSKTRRKRA